MAPHELVSDCEVDWELVEPGLDADAAAVLLAWWAAMPPPRPTKTAALSTAATTRDRAAGWRRRPGRRVPSLARRATAPRSVPASGSGM
ncbi:MAG TPA: hypothetical protein VG276_14390 [Actinomycetes bacterium]|nr:hypothetical protein [Actinomycetes bacterium]